MPSALPSPLKLAKQSVLLAAKHLGLLGVIAGSRWRQQRLLIVAFHSLAVHEEHHWRRLLYFTPDEFIRRLELLRRWDLNVLPLDEAITRLEAGTLPPRSAVLTFDDGLADFANISWPALQHFGFPATVYVTTYYSEKRVPVFPLMCSYLLWLARTRVLPALPHLGIAAATPLADDVDRELLTEHLIKHADLDGLNAQEKDVRLGELAAALEIDYCELSRRRVLQVMTAEEIAEIARRGADVQLHTHRHRVPLNRDAFVRELIDNRAHIEAATGKSATHFCYPSGVQHPMFLPWLAEMGVKSGSTCAVGLATRNDSLYSLPRLVDTASLSEIEVEGWLSGFSQCLLQRRGQAAMLPTRADFAEAR